MPEILDGTASFSIYPLILFNARITDIDTLTDATLYYCDKTQKITRGILKVSYDNKAIVGEGSLDVFTLNHELYYIKTGKLNIYTF